MQTVKNLRYKHNSMTRLLDLEDVDLAVDEKRFRPNFLIDGTFPPFDEETWVWVKMGEVVFRYSQVRPHLSSQLDNMNHRAEKRKATSLRCVHVASSSAWTLRWATSTQTMSP